MKDLYDLDLLRRTFEFDETTLVDAVRATFGRRVTPLPADVPIDLTEAFAADAVKRTQWTAFLRKATDHEVLELSEVVAGLRAWLVPVLKRARG